MTKYYSRGGKLTKLGIKEHNDYIREQIKEFENAITVLDNLSMKETDRGPMRDVLQGYISLRKSELIDTKR